jgi:hypothetical protein
VLHFPVIGLSRSIAATSLVDSLLRLVAWEMRVEVQRFLAAIKPPAFLVML